MVSRTEHSDPRGKKKKLEQGTHDRSLSNADVEVTKRKRKAFLLLVLFLSSSYSFSVLKNLKSVWYAHDLWTVISHRLPLLTDNFVTCTYLWNIKNVNID